jgi:hypothetical protein
MHRKALTPTQGERIFFATTKKSLATWAASDAEGKVTVLAALRQSPL